MKLAAIYNVWDGHELLEASIRSIRAHVDHVIVVYQTQSNWGEYDGSVEDEVIRLIGEGWVDQSYFFMPHGNAMTQETQKRQLGIQLAIDAKCTHFLSMDTDEFYDPEEFARLKQEAKHYDSTAVKIWVYYKRPDLRFSQPDKTYVPFIHRLYPFTKTGAKKYPVLADPTRRIEPLGKFKELDGYMHHLSWVRDDIEKKIMNSTAKNNINRADIRQDYENAEEGYHVKSIYDDVLVKSDFFDGKL